MSGPTAAAAALHFTSREMFAGNSSYSKKLNSPLIKVAIAHSNSLSNPLKLFQFDSAAVVHTIERESVGIDFREGISRWTFRERDRHCSYNVHLLTVVCSTAITTLSLR